ETAEDAQAAALAEDTTKGEVADVVAVDIVDHARRGIPQRDGRGDIPRSKTEKCLARARREDKGAEPVADRFPAHRGDEEFADPVAVEVVERQERAEAIDAARDDLTHDERVVSIV